MEKIKKPKIEIRKTYFKRWYVYFEVPCKTKKDALGIKEMWEKFYGL